MARKNNLTDKQSRFVDEYLVDLNATQAAIRAGYSKKTAYSIGQENLKKPEIQQAISEAQQSRSERTQITQDKVLKDLSELLDICMGRKQVLTTLTVKNTQEGIINTIETPTYTFDPSGANKALELMGKHLGMFRDKVELTGEKGNPVQTEHKGTLDFSKMTDDEVRLFIELGNKAALI